VLIVGGYGANSYPNIAPAELYDPVTGTFAAAGTYVGRDGCDFCAPSVALSDGSVLFPGQYPAQLYHPANDVFSPIGMMLREQSTAAVLMNGQVLFAGGEPIGRTADAELYNPATRTFVATASMASPRVWHTLTLLPNGMVLAAGGETDSCSGSGCWFAGSISTAELYDPSTGAFVAAGSMTAARETHTATVLKDGRVLIAGGVSYGGIGIYYGGTASAELYSPDAPVPAPVLGSVSSDGQGQGAVFHAGTRQLATADDPAAVGDSVDIYCTGLTPWRRDSTAGRNRRPHGRSPRHRHGAGRARREPRTRSHPDRHHAGTIGARAPDLSRTAKQRGHRGCAVVQLRFAICDL
jgi:hypothetical protein